MNTIAILFVVTSHAVVGSTGKPTGLWLEELSTPYYIFQDAGYDVSLASVAGGAVPVDPRSVENLAAAPASVQRFMQDKEAQARLKETPAIASVDTAPYAAIFLPGGHGTMWDLPGSKPLALAVSEALEEGRVVAAVCHGPAGLVSATTKAGDPVVKGRTLSAFTDSEEEAVGLTRAVPFLLESRLRELGAKVQTAPDFQPFAVADDDLITGQNPASSEKVALLVMERLAARGLVPLRSSGRVSAGN